VAVSLATLVTGGAGFIGSRLVRTLVGREEKTAVLDITATPSRIIDIIPKIKYVRGDVSDLNKVLHVAKENEIDSIYHLAALLTTDAEADPVKALRVNVNGTVNILEAARILDVRRVIFPSTRAIFGRGSSQPMAEDFPRKPVSTYGATKLLCEWYGEKFYEMYDVGFRAVRLVMVYGAGRVTGGSSFGSLLIENPALGKTARVPFSEREETDWLYVKDAVKALLMISEVNNLKRRIYNIKGETRTLGRVAEIVKSIIPSADIRFEPGPTPLSSLYPLVDDTAARTELGWSPSYTIEHGVKDHLAEILPRADPEPAGSVSSLMNGLLRCSEA